MKLKFADEGFIIPGIYFLTWDEFVQNFGTTEHRRRLIEGLKRALICFQNAGCKYVYIDGSFVTKKEIPGDYDMCWDTDQVDLDLLDSVLLDFSNKRAAQKFKYFGEMFPADSIADDKGTIFLDFFQIDKDSGQPKGIIKIELGGILP